MIMIKKLSIFLVLFLPLTLLCQPNTNSPYSRFGIGDIVDRNFYSSQFMGGLGASFTDPYQINIVNPASLSNLTATAFDIGLFAEMSGLRDGKTVDNPNPGPYKSLWSGNLNYISLALPLQNKVNDLLDRKQRDYALASAFTLMPFSTVGYNIATIENIENIGDVKKRFEGEGGTYQFVWSNAIRYKNLSFGLNLGYLFGKIEYSRSVEFDFSQPYFNSLFTETNRVSGFLYDLGLIYTLNLNSGEDIEGTDVGRKINFGIHGHGKSNLTSRASSFEGSIQSGTGVLDTLNFVDEMSFDGKLPSQIAMGISYYAGQKFALGINYTRSNWSELESNFVNNSLNNTSRLSLGGFYRPDYKSISSYFSRVYYRFGVFYNQVPNEIPENFDNTIEDIGFNLGFGMPFFYQRKISHANLGLTFGMKGRGTAIEERYLRISFSFTFNDDEWFIKRKYN